MAQISVYPCEITPTVDTKSQHFKAVKIFYKFVEIGSCLDFGFFTQKSFKIRIIWKLFTICRSVFLLTTFILYIDYDNINFTWAIYQLFFYFLNVIILVCFKPNRTFCQLLYDLEFTDRKLLTDKNLYNMEMKLVFCNIFFISTHVTESYFYCSFNVYTCSFMPPIAQYFYFAVVAFIDVVYVSKSFFFYSLYCWLNNFVSVLKAENIDITSMQHIYKNIVDVIESYVAVFQPLIFLGIAFKTLEAMAYLYAIIEQIIAQRLMEYQIFMEIAGVSSLVIFFAPSLFAEWVACQPEQIKSILQGKLLSEKDNHRQRELQRFIWYVKARGLRFRVYKVIPLDANLLGLVLNFVITYVIVIVQFIYK